MTTVRWPMIALSCSGEERGAAAAAGRGMTLEACNCSPAISQLVPTTVAAPNAALQLVHTERDKRRTIPI